MAVALLVVLVVVAVGAAVVLGVTLGRRLRDERARADGLEGALAASRVDASAASAARDGAVARAEGLDALVHSLWSLELLRVAREWTLTNGDVGAVTTVAADTGAELTTALRMELERRREESGIPGELDASPASAATLGSLPVASALGTLRFVEEVLAAVSRPSEGLTVGVRVDGARVVATITLDAADADVPPVLRDVAADAGATIEVDGATVTVALPC